MHVYKTRARALYSIQYNGAKLAIFRVPAERRKNVSAERKKVPRVGARGTRTAIVRERKMKIGDRHIYTHEGSRKIRRGTILGFGLIVRHGEKW